MTSFLKIEIIEKECTKRFNKFILDGPKYLFPLNDGTDILSVAIFRLNLKTIP